MLKILWGDWSINSVKHGGCDVTLFVGNLTYCVPLIHTDKKIQKESVVFITHIHYLPYSAVEFYFLHYSKTC